ncbi:hypothetical protein EJV47_18625 [Hymenobacter gummosus]|uniref:Uncharacterized protein n=1 Tax=Hymenobacter gummosus TaxID=1776032 RepID=A0A431TZ91_9BACT|nr:hypothetical protein [Hymenobacter gummosus]RTQ47442.1 hypothetical protein EJV47_18625 [Hymenobacter gummosus]
MSTVHFEAPLLQDAVRRVWWRQTWFRALLCLGGLGLVLAVWGLLGPTAATLFVIGLCWAGSRLLAGTGPQEAGQLLLGPERLKIVGRAEPWGRNLGPHSRLTLKYGGYRGLHRGRVRFDGTTNYLQLDAEPPLRFLLRDEQALQQLRAALQGWYEQGVPVREYCFNDRTFLLNPDMSYEEIQAFKLRYGVSLYQ